MVRCDTFIANGPRSSVAAFIANGYASDGPFYDKILDKSCHFTITCMDLEC